MHLVEAQGVEQAFCIIRQHVEVVGPFRCVGVTMPPRVEPIDPVIRQDRHLGIPHAIAGGQGMAHDDDGRIFWPLDGVVHLDAV